MKKIRIILSAFNIHTGGGLVLLSALFKNKAIHKFILDSRIKYRIKKDKKNFFIKKKFSIDYFIFIKILLIKMPHILYVLIIYHQLLNQN